MADTTLGLTIEDMLTYIKIETLRGLSPLEIFKALEELDPNFSVLGCSTIANWIREINTGRATTSNKHLSAAEKMAPSRNVLPPPLYPGFTGITPYPTSLTANRYNTGSYVPTYSGDPPQYSAGFSSGLPTNSGDQSTYSGCLSTYSGDQPTYFGSMSADSHCDDEINAVNSSTDSLSMPPRLSDRCMSTDTTLSSVSTTSSSTSSHSHWSQDSYPSDHVKPEEEVILSCYTIPETQPKKRKQTSKDKAVQPPPKKAAYRRYPKPPYSYCGMVATAIQNSPNQLLSLNEILETMTDYFPFFRDEYQGWRVSVRHSLSFHKCFKKNILYVRNMSNDKPSRRFKWSVDLSLLSATTFCRQGNDANIMRSFAYYLHDELSLPIIPLPNVKTEEVIATATDEHQEDDNGEADDTAEDSPEAELSRLDTSEALTPANPEVYEDLSPATPLCDKLDMRLPHIDTTCATPTDSPYQYPRGDVIGSTPDGSFKDTPLNSYTKLKPIHTKTDATDVLHVIPGVTEPLHVETGTGAPDSDSLPSTHDSDTLLSTRVYSPTDDADDEVCDVMNSIATDHTHYQRRSSLAALDSLRYLCLPFNMSAGSISQDD